ncbi:MAG TPA: LytTR family DNA-binding domain-containing protein [Steroidobacteraceae bacterium]|nr:LytTR family DNA-binding domain-containing protein [Steroidobacteraceae bacterium]
MNPLTAIIAEDEPLQRLEVRQSLNRHWPQLQISAEVGDGVEAIRALERYAPTIAFLDIQMPGASGLEVARHASGKSHVVFITAYDQYALQAFEHGAIDYILKPIDSQRMAVTVARLQRGSLERPADLGSLIELLKRGGSAGPQYLRWLTVPKGSELHVLAVSDIYYLRVDNKYTTIATRSTTFLLNTPLKDMQESLDPAIFWRIHRSIIVNVGVIDTIYRSFQGGLEVKVKDRGEILPVSATHAHLFKQA